MTTYLDLFVDSQFFEIVSFALMFSYILPWVLAFLVPDSLSSSPKRSKSKTPQNKLIAKLTPQQEQPPPKSVYFRTFILNFSMLAQFIMTLIIKIKKPTFWAFHYELPNLFRVLGFILIILFLIVYVWSLLLLPPRLRTKEGHCAPSKIIKSGPYSEV